jgi:hypothetical protein
MSKKRFEVPLPAARFAEPEAVSASTGVSLRDVARLAIAWFRRDEREALMGREDREAAA